jgi:hypothetical protein
MRKFIEYFISNKMCEDLWESEHPCGEKSPDDPTDASQYCKYVSKGIGYYYTYPNLKHHGHVNIEKDGQFIDSMEIWACSDFDRKDYENVGFQCRCCIDKFAKRFKNKPVSDRVLEQLGIIEPQEYCKASSSERTP